MGYIDVEQVSGFTHTSIQEWFLQSEIQSNLADLRSLELVDYTGVISLKMAALKRLFQLFKQNESEENKQQQVKFAEFVGAGGDSLLTQCVYDAIQEKMTETQVESWGWPVFPPEYQNPDSEQVAAFKNDHGELIEFYQFVQWQSAKQLQRVTHTANTLNMEVGLYGDIAVGAAQGSAQVWANQDLYRTQASIGAPPDVLGPQGQNWGLPPMDPVRLYEQGYQPFIDILSANMQYFGAVRIDHVMGLLRLWWVPQHEQATEGCYIHYPVDDLLGILALESHRNRTLVIGEDLGTVPDSIREKLQQWGIFSYKVFLFEKAPDGGFTSPQHYPSNSLSTLVTHDMPTLKGYWHCLDLVLGKELGVYQDENVLQQLYGSRHDDKQRILDSVHWHGCLPDWVSKWADKSEMNTALNHGLQTHMAQGNSALLSVQLEDWIEMDRPVNVPGTYQEYPNWRRKLDLTLTEIFNLENCTVLAERLSQARKSSNG
jgi:4-alpha-glucanotransferase